MIWMLAAVFLSYLIGSIPFAYIVSALVLKKDIRTTGSGNAGATNVYRALGTGWGFLVFFLDFLKGFVPVFLVLHALPVIAVQPAYTAVVSGLAAFIGHIFPIYIGGRGGKGMATGAGFVTALYPLLFPACLIVFIPFLLFTRKMSIASLATVCFLPFLYTAISLVLGEKPFAVYLCLMIVISILVILKHWKNIVNLKNGTERNLF